MADELPPRAAEPPADAEEWTDEQWIEWLAATDAPGDADGGRSAHMAHWRERPLSHVLGAAMLGLRDAIYGRPDDEVVVVADAPGEPGDDDGPLVELDPDHHEVVVRHRKGGR